MKNYVFDQLLEETDEHALHQKHQCFYTTSSPSKAAKGISRKGEDDVTDCQKRMEWKRKNHWCHQFDPLFAIFMVERRG